MTGSTINNALTRQFSTMFHVEAEQMISKTSPYVVFKSVNTADDFAYDSIGNVKANEIAERNQKVVFGEINFDRRKIAKRKFYVAIPIEGSDIRGMLIDPTSQIVRACVHKMNRVKDQVVAEAAFADVLTGREFGTTVTFANDGGSTIDATAGLTYDKLLEIRRTFKSVDVQLGRSVLLCTEQEEDALLKETELTSGDFTRIMPVDSGDLIRGVGMDIVTFGSNPKNEDPIIKVAAGTRDCIAIALKPDGTSGICVALSKEMEITIDRLPEFVETTLVKVVMELGAVRTEGVMVEKVQTTAT